MTKEYTGVDDLKKYLASNSYLFCSDKNNEDTIIALLNPKMIDLDKWYYDDENYGLMFVMTKEEAKEMRDYLDTMINYHG